MKKKTQIRLYINDPENKKELKKLAAELDKPMTEVTDFVIANQLKKLKEKKKERVNFEFDF